MHQTRTFPLFESIKSLVKIRNTNFHSEMCLKFTENIERNTLLNWRHSHKVRNKTAMFRGKILNHTN